MLTRVRPYLVLLLLTLLTTAPALAEPAPAAAAPDPERSSPRATLRTFLAATTAAVRDQSPTLLDNAAACLDLDAIPAGIRTTVGRDLALKLRDVLDRLKLPALTRVPDDPTGAAYLLHHDTKAFADILIAPDANGTWRFSRETVRRIEDLYARYATRSKTNQDALGIELSPALWLRAHVPPVLHENVFLLEHWQWLGLLALLCAGYLLGRLIRLLLNGPIHRALTRPNRRVPHDLAVRLLRPTSTIAAALVWLLGLPWLGLPPTAHVTLALLVKCVLALGVMRAAFRLVDVFLLFHRNRLDRAAHKADQLLLSFFDKTAKLIIIFAGAFFIAGTFGVSPTSLLAGLGIGGLAVALAAQDIVKNIFGSLTVVLDRPFEIGDDIKIGTDLEGTVETVGLRSTRIRTPEQTVITVPNGNLISANVDNLGKRRYWRYRALLPLALTTSPAALDAFTVGLRELVATHPNTRKSGDLAGLQHITATAFEVLFVCYFETATFEEQLAARHRLLCDIIALAARLDIALAVPPHDVHLHGLPPIPARSATSIAP